MPRSGDACVAVDAQRRQLRATGFRLRRNATQASPLRRERSCYGLASFPPSRLRALPGWAQCNARPGERHDESCPARCYNSAMSKVRKAVITAAGRGTRQYPASTAVQKEMFPLVDRDGLTKPIIQIIAEEALDSGIEEICIITQPGEESLYRDYFKRLDNDTVKAFRGKDWAILESEKLQGLGERLHFAEQHTPEGFGHAVYRAKKFVGEEPFLLLLGDHVYISNTRERCARQLTRVFEQYMLDAVTGVQPTLERDLHGFGTIRGEPVDANKGIYRAQLIIEKPA